MYAVIESGGKQYRVSEGLRLKLEKLPVDVGESFDFDKVLLVGEGDKLDVGTPYLSGKKVSATVLEHGRLKKIRIIKFKRRKHHLKQMGHRQSYTQVEINSIAGSTKKAAKAKAKVEAPVTAQTSEE